MQHFVWKPLAILCAGPAGRQATCLLAAFLLAAWLATPSAFAQETTPAEPEPKPAPTPPATADAAQESPAVRAEEPEAPAALDEQPEEASPSEQQQREQRLAAAFSAVAAQGNEQAARFIVSQLRRGDADAAWWRAYFEERWQPNWFTRPMTEFWDYAVRQTPNRRERTALVSALSAVSTLGKGLPRTGWAPETRLATDWLYALSQDFSGTSRERVFSALREDMAGVEAQIMPLPGAQSGFSQASLQFAVVTAAYASSGEAGRAATADILRMDEARRSFWERNGILLFDAGALTELQVTILDSVFQALPAGLHNIVVAAVAAPTGLDPAAPGVQAPGRIVFFEAIPMNQRTSPGEFYNLQNGPTAPAFTTDAVLRVMYAIQEQQFAQRPGLEQKRDLILRRAGRTRDAYLRSTTNPGVYLNQPQNLLPYTSVLWTVDSERAFGLALDLLSVGLEEPMNQYLLLLDMLSGGSGQTVLAATGANGVLSSRNTPIERVRLAELRPPGPLGAALPDLPLSMEFIRRLQIGGRLWTFTLDGQGSVTGWLR